MTERKNVYHSNFFAMGTRMDVVLPLIDNELGDLIFNTIKNETLRIEKKLSRFDSQSEIYYINHNAHKEPCKIDAELYLILEQSINYHKLTNGYFDITSRPLLQSYMKHNSDSEFEVLKQNLDYNNIILQNDSISFKNNIIEFDMGGFGKGYALEKIRDILKEKKIDSAFISFGESSILAHGNHPFGKYWGVGIKHLFENGNVYTFEVKDKSLSTSGITPSNQKKFAGHSHIINPKTGQTQNTNKTITAISESPLDAEVLSTALMVNLEKETQEIINRFPVDDVVEITYSADNSFEKKKLLTNIEK